MIRRVARMQRVWNRARPLEWTALLARSAPAKGGTTVMRKSLGRPSRRYPALAATVVVSASIVVALLPGAGGAAGKAVPLAGSAKRVSATSLGAPRLVRVDRLPKVKAGISRGEPQTLNP